MELWKILFGVLAAVALVHFRSAYLLAQKQQLVSRRLRSYLLYWQGWVIDNKAFSIFHVGVEWNKEIDELIKGGDGAAEMVALKEKKREMINEIKTELDKVDKDSGIDLSEIMSFLERLPANSIDHILKAGTQFEQNLLDGKTFISDDDACALGPYCAQLCVNLKMNIISGASKFIGQIVLFLAAPDKYSIKGASKEISELLWLAILISKDIDALTKYIDRLGKQSLWNLTWNNFRVEPKN